MTAVLACATVASVSGQTIAPLSDAQALAAIKIGETGRLKPLTTTCSAHPSVGESMTATRAGGVQRDGGYTVVVATAAGEVASRAAAAKQRSRRLTLADVTDDMRSAGVVLLIEPEPPSTTRSSTQTSIAAVIQYVVLQSHSTVETVTRPERVDTEPVELPSLLGVEVQGNRAVARFSLNAVHELPAGDFDVVVITHEGERRCTVSQKERRRLFSRRD